LALMVSDGERVHTLRAGLNGSTPPTLFSRVEPGGGCFASEPLDDDESWLPIESGGYATIDTGGVLRGA
jgi:predicted glutamine amidotransferase